MKNKRQRTLKLIVKIGLFALILSLGTIVALNSGEIAGLARVDLADVAVDKIVTTVKKDTLYAEIEADSPADGFYRSLDNGRTWQNVGQGPATQVNVLAVDSSQETALYAGGLGGPLETTRNLWRSEDGGRSWQPFLLNLPAGPDHRLPPITALATDPARPEALYVGTAGHGVYRVDKIYPGYELVGGTSLSDAHVVTLAVGPAQRLLALTTAGLFVTGGQTWSRVETPENFISLVAAPDADHTLYGGGASMGVYRSTDGGETWAQINAGLDLTPGVALRVTALAVDETTPDVVAAATAYGLGSRITPGGVYRSRNNGQAWTKVADLDSVATRLAINDDVVHATNEAGLKRYENAAETSLAETISPVPLSEPQGPAPLTGGQIVVLLLMLAGVIFILANPLRWLEGWREKADR